MDRIDQLKQWLAEDSSNSFLRYALAKEYENQQFLEPALEQYCQLMEHDPGYIATYYHLGKLYEKLNKFSEAKETYQTGVHLAQTVNDLHSLAELKAALLELTIS